MAPAAAATVRDHPHDHRRHRLRRLLLIMLICVASSELVAGVNGQLDSVGFISIDCGIADGGGYSDESTNGLRYVPDAGFVDAGAEEPC
ncbi:hypothetical protein GUJ93_ZPchr0009g1483 [Zizania palustris]|uniref:Uncharacterized protein n=1 Tax=Zizania palustris TaxID=103762 RepID=A0A8J5RH38_ZIZPA|nr:hypothetical protein GUJ93_ZPchr0009g1483 [Zizania palustris]